MAAEKSDCCIHGKTTNNEYLAEGTSLISPLGATPRPPLRQNYGSLNLIQSHVKLNGLNQGKVLF